jgi:hypothetical protein
MAGVTLVAFAAGLIPFSPAGGPAGQPVAQAQNFGQRLVAGTVFDPGDAPVLGATVFLKNLKTKAIRSYSTDEKGHFRFTQVNMAEDHELWAEKDGKKSAVKTVSSWDSRKDFESELKLK